MAYLFKSWKNLGMDWETKTVEKPLRLRFHQHLPCELRKLRQLRKPAESWKTPPKKIHGSLMAKLEITVFFVQILDTAFVFSKRSAGNWSLTIIYKMQWKRYGLRMRQWPGVFWRLFNMKLSSKCLWISRIRLNFYLPDFLTISDSYFANVTPTTYYQTCLAKWQTRLSQRSCAKWP